MNTRKRTPRFPDYTGSKKWKGSHPEFGLVEVFAPSKQAAIVTAADAWKQKWTRYEFYSECVVVRI